MEMFDGFISAIAGEFKIRFHKDEDGNYTTNIEFEDGRSQKIFIAISKDESGDGIIKYYSIIGKLKRDLSELYKFLLQQNVTLDYGSIALLNDMLIIRGSILLDECNPHQFIKSLVYIAAKADEFEELFAKNNVY